MNLPAVHSVPDCTRLLQSLGYDATLAPISRDAWPRGLPAPAGRWWYGGSFGSLDLHVLEASETLDGETTLRALTNWNTVRSHALVHVMPEQARILLGRYGRRTASLRLHPQQRTEDLERRLALLRRSSSERRDPAELFGRALESDSTGRRFFDRFRKAVAQVALSVRASTRASMVDCQDEALLLMCRLLFLRFVERKGWLDGNVRFLSDRIERVQGGQGIWRSLLQPLFFGCLNQPVSRRRVPASLPGHIPYLNGGLFERSDFERRYQAMDVSDESLTEAFAGLFDVFDFSVSEETEDVTSIDPEMLGRVFESLMEQDERNASGSFYTPPAIVDRIVTEAIAERLATNSREYDGLVSVMNGGSWALGRGRAAEIAAASRELTILDPACGTGAFLLSALHKLEALARGLHVSDVSRRFVVENQLYGIDQKREAVRLCELRLWLAVVATESCDARDVQPLPNLDRNIAQGDTLVSPLDFRSTHVPNSDLYVSRRAAPELGEYRRSSGTDRARYRRLLERSDRRRALELVDRALHAIETAPKQESFGVSRCDDTASQRALMKIRRRIDKGELPFFDWRITFADVADRGGFDLVIGNPPWVRHSRIEPRTRQLLSMRYSWFEGRSRGFRQPDLYIAFLQRSVQLCAPGGVIAMLVPAKLLTASYASEARREICRNLRLRALWRASDDAFDADSFPLHLRVRNARPDAAPVLDGCGTLDPALIEGTRPGGPWIQAPERVLNALRSMERTFPPLSADRSLQPRMGVKTGANELFVREDLIARDDGTWMIGNVHLPRGSVVRLLRGRDLRNHDWGEGALMLWPPGLANLEVRALERLAKHLGTDARRLFHLESNVRDLQNAIAWKDLALRFAPCTLPSMIDGYGGSLRAVPNQTLYYVNPASRNDAHALEMLLGTTPVATYAMASADVAKDRHRRYMGATIAAVPFPPASSWRPLTKELTRLRPRVCAGDRDARDRVDQISSRLFGLSTGDLRAMRLWLDAELGG